MENEGRAGRFATWGAMVAGMVAGGAPAQPPRQQVPFAPDRVQLLQPPTKEPIDPAVQSQIKLMADRLSDTGEKKREATPKEIAALIVKLGSEKYPEREEASKELRDIGYPVKNQILTAMRKPPLNKHGYPDEEVRKRAMELWQYLMRIDKYNGVFLVSSAEILANKGEAAAPAFPQLLQALDVEYVPLQMQCVKALGNIGAAATGAAPAITELMAHPDNELRTHAAEALGKIGAVSDTSISALITGVDDDYFYVRRASAESLGKMGKAAKPAIPRLIKAVDDPNGSVKLQALRALGRIGEPTQAVVSELAAALKDTEVGVRNEAAWFLGEFGPAAKSAIPQLIEALRDESRNVAINAAQALGKMGPEAKAALPALEILKNTHKEPQLDTWQEEIQKRREMAADALKKINGR